VIFDEVFTGLYRLGRFSAASFLQTAPDISVHAKLLTGGLLPLCATVASNGIFEAFLGDEKSDALLHGHSYTAHPIGCHVANVSLEQMANLDHSVFKKKWINDQTGKERGETANDANTKENWMWSMWSKKTVEALSFHPKVDHVIAIGSVLAISLVDNSGAGEIIPSLYPSQTLLTHYLHRL